MAIPNITSAGIVGANTEIVGSGFTTNALPTGRVIYDGLESASASDVGTVDYVSGKYGKCADFGADGYRNLGTDWNSAGAFTHLAWIYVVSNPTTRYIISRGETGGAINGNFTGGTRLNSSGQLSVYLNGQDGGAQKQISAVSTSPLATGWHMVATTWDGTASDPNFFVDGIIVARTPTFNNWTGSTTLNTGSGEALCGAFYSGGGAGFFNEKIDELTIYERVLSDSEILDWYNLTKTFENGVLVDESADSTTSIIYSGGTGGNTIEVFNKDGSDSAVIASGVTIPKITLTYDSTDYEIMPPLFGYTSNIKHDWEVNQKSNKEIGIYDSGSNYDIYECECTFQLPDDEANTLLSLQSSTARGEEVVLTCSSGFFPFTPFRGDGVFTVRTVIDSEGARKIDGIWQIDVKFINTGSFPAYTPASGSVQGSFQIGSVTGLPYPKSGYNPSVEYAIKTDSNYGATFVNYSNTDSYISNIDMELREGNCADVVEQLLSDRSANTTIAGGDNYFIFGREKGDGSFTAFRINPVISVTNSGKEKFKLSVDYKWVS